ISAGGCPIIVAALDDKLVFAHAGRDCVLDRTYIESDGSRKGREHESVVDSVCAALEATSSSVRYARVHVLGSIRPEHFMHPFGHSKHGDYNAHLYRFLKRYYPDCYQYEKVTAIGPDLPRIIRQQFVDRGVLESQVRLEDAYLPEGLSARFQGGNADRYLTVVVRRT
ncbi:MAG TPA: hypothetical protein VF803_02780, partial [Candidatus Paceibacterota bacterium]